MMLPETNPDANAQLVGDEFAASRSGKPFSQVPIDQILDLLATLVKVVMGKKRVHFGLNVGFKVFPQWR